MARARRPRPPYDLFGEIPVTWPEVVAWCELVAGLRADSPRLTWYARNWNVPDKIRAAKLAGELDAILAAPPARPWWELFGQRRELRRGRPDDVEPVVRRVHLVAQVAQLRSHDAVDHGAVDHRGDQRKLKRVREGHSGGPWGTTSSARSS
jgi:hypothetical protein